MGVARGSAGRTEPRLDSFARSLAGDPVSRRDTLKGAAVVAGGAAVSSPLWGWAERAAAAVARKPRCAHGHAACGHGCCKPNQVCVHPKRRKHSKKTPKPKCECLAPHRKCSSGCVDVRSDPHNCGACGHKCPSGQVCSHGHCLLECPAGETACGSACVNLQSDPHNCKTCGNVCPAPAGGTAGCVNGLCEQNCSMARQTACEGVCVNLVTDASNCGTCSHVCPSGQVCSGGQCMVSCPSGETACGTSCVNLQTDPANCNGCGSACPPPTGGVATCAGGVCRHSCTTAGETVCDGVCVDTQTDAANCGGCSTDCSGSVNGHICVSGNCGCAQDGDCATGNRCSGNTCVPLLADGDACDASDECLHGACIPDATNTNNSICCASSCADQGSASCGTNGTCKPDGSGCGFYASGVSCASATCNNGMAQAASTCNGGGSCEPGGTSSCAPYVCSGTGCGTSCDTDNNTGCASGYYCGAATCHPLETSGSSCTLDLQCASGTCNFASCGSDADCPNMDCANGSCLTGACSG